MKSQTKLQKYLARRRLFEIAGTACLVLVITSLNATTELMDDIRAGHSVGIAPFLSEYSSGVVIFALIPLIIAFHHRFRIRWPSSKLDALEQSVLHLAGFVVFCILHVGGMYTVRYLFTPVDLTLADIFNWFEWLYEGRKDLVTYISIVVLIYGYEFILTRLQGEASLPLQQPDTYSRRDHFLVKMLQQEYLIPIREIEWIESARNYALLHVGERSFPIRRTMQNLEVELSPFGFERIHRTAIVALDSIQCVSERDNGPVAILESGAELPIGPSYLGNVRSRLVHQ